MQGDVEESLLYYVRRYFTSEVYALLMADSGITHKAIHTLKSIDTFGIFNGAQTLTFALVCMYFPSCAYGSFHLCSLLFDLIFQFLECIFSLDYMRGTYTIVVYLQCLSFLLLQFANSTFFSIHCDVPCLFMLTIQSSFLCLCIVRVFKDNLQRCS